MVMPLPPAAPADIVRARTKDEEYISELEGRLHEILQAALPNSVGTHAVAWSSLKRLLRFAYYIITPLGRVPKTAGEEYACIVGVQIMDRVRVPTKAASVLVATLLAVSQDDLIWMLGKVWRHLVPWLSFPKVAVSAMVEGVSRLHLAFFYLYGRYYNIANRVVGTRYVETARDLFTGGTPLQVLGVVVGVQLAADLLRTIARALKSARRESRECEGISGTVARAVNMMMYPGEARGTSGEEGVGRCILCLSGLTSPTLTACGHVFCWKCIGSWCATNVS